MIDNKVIEYVYQSCLREIHFLMVLYCYFLTLSIFSKTCMPKSTSKLWPQKEHLTTLVDTLVVFRGM